MRNQKSYTIEEAQKALEHYCSYQERSHREVDEKLQSLGMIPEAREKILISLLQNDFLNEERFAKTYARGKFSINKWGKLKIKQHLVQKGVSKANINIGLAEITEETYFATIQSLAEKYQQKNKETNPYKRKQKLFRYLQQKGFETSVIYEYVLSVDN